MGMYRAVTGAQKAALGLHHLFNWPERPSPCADIEEYVIASQEDTLNIVRPNLCACARLCMLQR